MLLQGMMSDNYVNQGTVIALFSPLVLDKFENIFLVGSCKSMLFFSNSRIQWVYYNLKAHLDVTFVYKKCFV